MLKVKLLRPEAKVPTVGHPGEDLGFDLYAAEGAVLAPGSITKVDTGIAATFEAELPYGLIVKDRSSMASKGISVLGGVIDHGYTGSIVLILANLGSSSFEIQVGQKVAQMLPIKVCTGYPVVSVYLLNESSRADAGFGSTGL